jgi:hypothetical protein
MATTTATRRLAALHAPGTRAAIKAPSRRGPKDVDVLFLTVSRGRLVLLMEILNPTGSATIAGLAAAMAIFIGPW